MDPEIKECFKILDWNMVNSDGLSGNYCAQLLAKWDTRFMGPLKDVLKMWKESCKIAFPPANEAGTQTIS